MCRLHVTSGVLKSILVIGMINALMTKHEVKMPCILAKFFFAFLWTEIKGVFT